MHQGLACVVSLSLACSGSPGVVEDGARGGGFFPGGEDVLPADDLPDEPAAPFDLWTGDFNVDQAGNSTYRIELGLPPGRRSVEPSLALAYSSGRAESLLGVGWTLEGLDEIGLCGRNLPLDAVRAPVQLDNQDPFCWGGERLVEVPSTGGHTGLEFRVQHANRLAKLIAYDNGLPRSDPDWAVVRWEARESNGEVRKYGTAPDSRVDDGTGRARRWLLDRVSDRSGNLWTVQYDRPATGLADVRGEDTEVLPKRLEWIGNDGSTGAPGLAPMNAVVFEYGLHSVPRRGFRSGVSHVTRHRVSRVVTYHESNPVRIYSLGYRDSATTGRSLLSDARLCDFADRCLPAIEFEYSAGLSDFEPPIDVSANLFFGPNLPSGGDEIPKFYADDINGDARTDVVTLWPAGDHNAVFSAVSIAGTTPFAPAEQWPWLMPENEVGRFFVDFADGDGDGRKDLLYYRHTAVGSTPADWTLIASGTFASDEHYAIGSSRAKFVDLNGDGWTDQLSCSSSGTLAYRLADSTGALFGTMTGLTGFSDGCFYLLPDNSLEINREVHDLDGDGALEVLIRGDSGDVWTLDFSTEPPVARQEGIDPEDFVLGRRKLLDVNGDGLKDFVNATPSGHRIYFNLGTHFDAGLFAGPISVGASDGALPIDVNQDGRTDLVDLGAGGGAAQVFVSDGLGYPNSYSSAQLPTLGQDKRLSSETSTGTAPKTSSSTTRRPIAVAPGCTWPARSGQIS